MDMSEKHISRLINGEVKLTPETAVRLEMVLGVPAKFWNNLEAIYREKIAKQFPYSEIGLTARGRDADRFWFSLFHELAHIVLGHAGRPDGTSDEDEKAADEWSGDTLISPGNRSRKDAVGGSDTLGFPLAFFYPMAGNSEFLLGIKAQVCSCFFACRCFCFRPIPGGKNSFSGCTGKWVWCIIESREAG